VGPAPRGRGKYHLHRIRASFDDEDERFRARCKRAHSVERSCPGRCACVSAGTHTKAWFPASNAEFLRGEEMLLLHVRTRRMSERRPLKACNIMNDFRLRISGTMCEDSDFGLPYAPSFQSAIHDSKRRRSTPQRTHVARGLAVALPTT
jgi:hypothetical protein